MTKLHGIFCGKLFQGRRHEMTNWMVLNLMTCNIRAPSINRNFCALSRRITWISSIDIQDLSYFSSNDRPIINSTASQVIWISCDLTNLYWTFCRNASICITFYLHFLNLCRFEPRKVQTFLSLKVWWFTDIWTPSIPFQPRPPVMSICLINTTFTSAIIKESINAPWFIFMWYQESYRKVNRLGRAITPNNEVVTRTTGPADNIAPRYGVFVIPVPGWERRQSVL